MKVGVFVPCYYLDDYLGRVIDFYKHWDEIVVIRKDFKEYGQVNVRNEGIDRLKHCDFVWTVDGDEIILPEDQEKILKGVVDQKKDSAFISVLDYADENHIYKPRDHKPVVLLNPKEVRFYETRCVRHNQPLSFDNCYLHHLGFTFQQEKMKWKKDNYWNVGDTKQVDKIMRKDKVEYNVPEEIKKIIREKKC